MISPLQKFRASYSPKLPPALMSGNLQLKRGATSEPATHQDQVRSLFPQTYGQPLVTLVEGAGELNSAPLKVGVVLSGGQAPGGHNVIAGLFDALKAINSASQLVGFLKGPGGVIKGDCRELLAGEIDSYRNTGGFDMIMSGRDKIETPEQLAACATNFRKLGLDGLVVIGGDDSNTNAAVLAEYLLKNDVATRVIGVPKTIDGDMKNEEIEVSFGFHTAAQTYSEMIGNIARDAMSAVKYWHFIRLMGRAASHVTLECALQTHPNVALISEEIEQKEIRWEQIVDSIVDVVHRRAEAGRNYGVVLIPEGLVEFCSDFDPLLKELGEILGSRAEELEEVCEGPTRVKWVGEQLTAGSAAIYESLPSATREILLRRDSHGNLLLSQVETERILAEVVEHRINALAEAGQTKAKFNWLPHFLGYEGRCAYPTNFDADYTYTLGYTAAQLIRGGLTGYTVAVRNLTRPHTEWIAGGIPVTGMLNMETRKGKSVPVIRKALVELEGKPFREFASHRDSWAIEDAFVFPGPIQYYGPSEVCDAPPLTLTLERGG